MKTFGRIITALGLAIAAAFPANALSNLDFVNTQTHAASTELIAIQLALTTEAYRSAKAELKDRAACITNNFVNFTDGKKIYVTSAFRALSESTLEVKNISPKTQTEDLIVGAINKICDNPATAPQIDMSGVEPVHPRTAMDFFHDFAKQAKDKELVLIIAAATQASRAQKTRPIYAQCIREKFTFDVNAKEAPQGFSDLYRKLQANKQSGSIESLEQTIMDTITDPAECGPEPNELSR
jgi:hypothetical protein